MSTASCTLPPPAEAVPRVANEPLERFVYDDAIVRKFALTTIV